MPQTQIQQDINKGYRHPFLFGIHYLGGVGDNPRTVTELAMCNYSALLRKQPEWWTKYRDETVRHEWRQLARLPSVSIVRTPSSTAEVELSEEQVEYVIDELAGYAALRDEANQCQVSCFERIWESDTLLSDVENAKLFHSLTDLRDLPTCTRSDDGNTVNLIDPLLHCLVYNQTLVSFAHRISSRPITSPPKTDIYTVCSRFALLPSDVWVARDGQVKFLSYINNLYKEDNAPLYTQLGHSLGKFIPLFEHTLTDLHRNNPLPQRITGRCRYTVWEEPEAPEYSDDEEGWGTYERELRHWVLNRPILLPDIPKSGYPGGLEDRKFTVSLRGRRLQVIVDVTETRLDNISPTSIQFRMAVTYPRGFPAGDTGATSRTWGFNDGDACHQYIGQTPLRTGLSLVFPNIYQHRQSPFELVDPTREGRLTLLMFYMIDPDIPPIISTGVVPPQQKEWIQKALIAALSPKIPVELIEEIMKHTIGLMELHEAEDYRRAFLDIQAKFRQASNNYHFCIPFDVWNGPDFSYLPS
ncbi:hypothetical protein NP233_g1217 [Leucocoprinus birnbaumii]|uniref:Uncharacterized protein n=1 Tax=Leucocoprinus birnbaumii TaxID=56174 RepID=A0AAD5YY53_9AGAR|nr:hypothetical protein NP233_g1217 [Leucocoprinus birnbaumii]